MQTDKELLELAAKAIGKEIWTDCDGNFYTYLDDEAGYNTEIEWKPHLDGGDSHNLQEALKIDLVWNQEEKIWNAAFYGEDFSWFILRSDFDLKRVVLLVAAAIGEKML